MSATTETCASSRAGDVITTRIWGYATRGTLAAMAAQWDALGGAPIWAFDLTGATGYDGELLRASVAVYGARLDRGLRAAVYLTASPLHRMAAGVVAMLVAPWIVARSVGTPADLAPEIARVRAVLAARAVRAGVARPGGP